MNDKDNTAMNKQDSGIIGLLRQHWVGVAVLLLIYDAIAVNVSFFSALWVRFDCRFSMIPARYLSAWLHFTPIYTVFCVYKDAYLVLPVRIHTAVSSDNPDSLCVSLCAAGYGWSFE